MVYGDFKSSSPFTSLPSARDFFLFFFFMLGRQMWEEEVVAVLYFWIVIVLRISILKGNIVTKEDCDRRWTYGISLWQRNDIQEECDPA